MFTIFISPCTTVTNLLRRENKDLRQRETPPPKKDGPEIETIETTIEGTGTMIGMTEITEMTETTEMIETTETTVANVLGQTINGKKIEAF